MPSVIYAESDEHLTQLIEEHSTNKPENLLIIDFFAQWCGPCRLVGPKVDQMAVRFADNPNLQFVKADVDEMEDSPADYDISVMPTFIFLRAGQEIARFSGANHQKLLELVEQHATGSGGGNSEKS